MSEESPLAIIHIRSRLRQDFTGKLLEVTFGTQEDKERHFLSHVLAAFNAAGRL